MNTSQFKPAFGLSNRHLQTLYSTFFIKHPVPKIEIEEFTLQDGDFLECYWHNKPHAMENKPIVVLFHGLAGSFESPYIQALMNTLASEGFASVLMHFRGCSGKLNRLARSYHSGDTLDAKEYLKHLATEYPNATLLGVGYSLGANMLLKLLGEMKNESPLHAGVSISAPMQLDICSQRINKGFSKIYQAYLMQSLKKSLLQKYKSGMLDSLGHLNEGNITQLHSFLEFDEAYTAPAHGFASAQEYYTQSSSKQYLQHIQTPTLIIHALDDPFMTPEVLPTQQETSSYVKLEVHNNGGHVGFIGGTVFRPKFYLPERIVQFLKEFT